MFVNKSTSILKWLLSDSQPVQWAKPNEIKFGCLSEHIPKSPVRTFSGPWCELFHNHICMQRHEQKSKQNKTKDTECLNHVSQILFSHKSYSINLIRDNTHLKMVFGFYFFLSEPESITNIQLYSQQMFLKKEF